MLDNVSLEKVDDGALWMISITDAPLKYNLIGVVTNHEIKITLKDGKTLEELGTFRKKKFRLIVYGLSTTVRLPRKVSATDLFFRIIQM